MKRPVQSAPVLEMKTRLARLTLFIDEIERLDHFIDVLNALSFPLVLDRSPT